MKDSKCAACAWACFLKEFRGFCGIGRWKKRNGTIIAATTHTLRDPEGLRGAAAFETVLYMTSAVGDAGVMVFGSQLLHDQGVSVTDVFSS